MMFKFWKLLNLTIWYLRALPQMIPLCPGNWWVHTRMVYLPMGYIYARRLNPEPTDFILQLREELYTEPYDGINWDAQRNNVSEADLFLPHTKIIDFLNGKESAGKLNHSFLTQKY
jgi:lanosterol synthase